MLVMGRLGSRNTSVALWSGLYSLGDLSPRLCNVRVQICCLVCSMLESRFGLSKGLCRSSWLFDSGCGGLRTSSGTDLALVRHELGLQARILFHDPNLAFQPRLPRSDDVLRQNSGPRTTWTSSQAQDLG